MTTALLRRIEVGDQQVLLVRIEDHRARRDGNHHVLPALAVHLLAHAGLALVGVPVMLAGEVEQRVLVGVGDEDDRAAIAPIAAVRAALGNVLLAPKGHAPVSPVAGMNVNDCFVDEHGHHHTRPSPRLRRGAVRECATRRRPAQPNPADAVAAQGPPAALGSFCRIASALAHFSAFPRISLHFDTFQRISAHFLAFPRIGGGRRSHRTAARRPPLTGAAARPPHQRRSARRRRTLRSRFGDGFLPKAALCARRTIRAARRDVWHARRSVDPIEQELFSASRDRARIE